MTVTKIKRNDNPKDNLWHLAGTNAEISAITTALMLSYVNGSQIKMEMLTALLFIAPTDIFAMALTKLRPNPGQGMEIIKQILIDIHKVQTTK